MNLINLIMSIIAFTAWMVFIFTKEIYLMPIIGMGVGWVAGSLFFNSLKNLLNGEL